MSTGAKAKERPILFSGPMVRAILDGTKTQTRRAIKPQPAKRMFWAKLNEDDWAWAHRGQPHRTTISNSPTGPAWYASECPYGRPGDRLWVRETFLAFRKHHQPPEYAYRADCTTDERCREELGYTWTTPIHMPRAASRITLEITDVRVQRLQEITPDDLTAEGFPPDNSPPHDGTRLTFHGRKMCYAELWDSLNTKPGHTWDDNPWVWVITCRRIT